MLLVPLVAVSAVVEMLLVRSQSSSGLLVI